MTPSSVTNVLTLSFLTMTPPYAAPTGRAGSTDHFARSGVGHREFAAPAPGPTALERDPPTEIWRRARLRAPEQEVRLIAEERRALSRSRGHVPRRELRKSRVARVRLGLNEVSQEA